MDYAIIKLGNKQHRVRDGETLVVDRLPTGAGEVFEPVVLLGDATVTATVLEHGRGKKILIGKYRRRTGYKRHNGFRAATSKVEITIGAGTARKAAAKAKPPKEQEAPKVEAEVVEAAPVEAAEVEVAPVEELAPVAEAPAEVEAPVAEAADEDVPAGYEKMTVAQVKTATGGWSVAELQAALAHEEAHGARKGAISALESAIAKDEEDEDGA
jgi:large subunit ribosomal protein L21